MSQKVLLTAKVLLLGLMSTPSLAFTHMAWWTEVRVECPAPHNDPLNTQCADYYEFAIKDDAVYWRDEQILGADPASFEMINRYYAKDKNHVYQNFSEAYRSYLDSTDFSSMARKQRSWALSATHDNFWEIIYLADPKTFKIHPQYNEYSYDKNYLYHKGLLIAQTDGTSLKQLNNAYWTTNDAVFLYDQLLPQVEAESFAVFSDNSRVTKDKNNAYFDNEIQRDVRDPLSFQVLNHDVAKDAVNIYSIDSSNIKIMSDEVDIFSMDGNLVKDKPRVYYRDNLVKKIGLKTFKVLDKYGDFSIKKSYAFLVKVDIAPLTFGEYGSSAEDKNKGYSFTDRVTSKVASKDTQKCNCASKKKSTNNQSQDPFIQLSFDQAYPSKYFLEKSEERFDLSWNSPYRGDRAGTYQVKTLYWKNSKTVAYGKKHLTDLDVNSFVVIDANFGKDHQFVYYQDQLIEGADTESFIVLDSDYSRDKNQLFYQQNKVTDLTQNNTVEKPYRDYYGGELLKRTYSDELEIYHQLPYAKVGTDVFYQDELIKQIDSQTLNPVRVFRKNYRENSSYTFSKYYIRDERNIYYQAEKVEGADPNSFIVTNEPDENSRFRNATNGQDKFSCYEETKAVKCK